MKKFLDKDFLLNNEVAHKLYHEYAANLPIIDYHCHVNPKEIYENKRFENITEVWLARDHYKWRIMRSNGIDEYFITGDASAYDKFLKFASSLKKAIGNPMYHWCHLELKKYFGYEGILNEETAPYVWELANKKLQEEDLRVRDIIRLSNVHYIGTTDDPLDDLKWHKLLLEDDSIQTRVAPTFRPDKALNLDKDGWNIYIQKLGEVVGFNITTLNDLKKALRLRIEYFSQNGCLASDHGLDYFFYQQASEEEKEIIFNKAIKQEKLSIEEIEIIKTELLLYCSRCYKEKGWVMQLHYNCMRNPNSVMLERLGPDTGFDCIGPNNGSTAIAKFLDSANKEDILPKTIIYSLDASDNTFIDTLIGAFQSSEIPLKIQHGSAWWFNDNKQGMKEQLISLANLSLLGNFVGMLTDSRSFLSYTRHEYFRRILCNLVGEWVENGEYPEDYDSLKEIITGICFYNALKYFNMEK